jgi:hypothetical protein
MKVRYKDKSVILKPLNNGLFIVFVVLFSVVNFNI